MTNAIADIANGESGSSTRSKLNKIINALRFDAIVDAGGGGSHTTLEAAMAAVSTGARIAVLSDLTITPAADTVQYEFAAEMEVHFLGSRITNNGDGDVFGTNVPIGSDGQVNRVKLYDPYVTRSAGGRSAGRAFNMHGAYHWQIYNAYADKHAVGHYMDATPYPSGQCSHNKFWGGLIVDCAIGVHNTGDANVNEWHGLNIINCDVHIDHTSGLNPLFVGLKCENLSEEITPLIYARSNGLRIFGLHMEAKASVGALTLEAASAGTVVDGDIYNQGGGSKIAVESGARYSIRTNGKIIAEHGANRAQTAIQLKLPDISATTTVTVGIAPVGIFVKSCSIIANGFTNYAVGDYWTVAFEEWNGNVKVDDIGTYTQGAQIGLARVGVTGLHYELTQERTVRAVFTKTGAPPNISAPIIMVEYDVKPD